MILRPYQISAINEIRYLFATGNKKVCLWAATGSGKGIILSEILERVASRCKRALFVVHGRQLVDQGSKRLNCDHGVLMANHPKYDLSKPIQVCSIDTIRARDIYPDTELIVVDEAHMCQSPSYIRLSERYPDKLFLGVTATPFQTKSITHICQTIVRPITHQQLVDLGFLVPSKVYEAQKVDLSGIEVSRSTRDYKEDQLGDLMNKSEIVGEVAPAWIKFAENRPTLTFAVTVDHSISMCMLYNKAGIPAAHMDASTSRNERERIINDHKEGRIKVISNVGILHVGVDLPWVACLQICRPTKSLVWHLQACGRGTRIYPDKHDFIVLDHAGNTKEHGFIEDDREPNLDGFRQSTKGEVPVKTCPECQAIIKIHVSECPYCNYKYELKPHDKGREHISGEFVELTKKDVYSMDRMIDEKMKLLRIAKRYNLKRGFVYYKLVEKFGKTLAGKLLPWSGSQEISESDLIRTL